MVPFLHPLYSSISVSYSIWTFSYAYFFFLEFDEQNLLSLSAGQRLNIAIDIARCLDYLHNERVIPHGNNKSSNVLIQNSTPSALVTDYSLHRLMTLIGMAEQVLNTGALGYSPPNI
jgi:serine/threonine protein kinase